MHRASARLRPAHAPAITPTRRLRRPALLIIGCGDVGQRFVQQFADRFRIIGLTRRPEARAFLRAAGARGLAIDLDDARACQRLSGLAQRVVHCAPPPATGPDDPRTRRALAALPRARTWVYLSTTGVYGDCQGQAFDESRPVAPRSARAVRRVAAERRLRRHAARGTARVSVLRVPGIYAADRLPTERLTRQTPALHPDDDVWTNHIHADDLARIIFYALCRGRSQRTVHAVDHQPMKMGAYFDLVAQTLHLPAPPRLHRTELKTHLSPMQWTFMSESRRLINQRLTQELRVRLRWPTTIDFLATLTRPQAQTPFYDQSNSKLE